MYIFLCSSLLSTMHSIGLVQWFDSMDQAKDVGSEAYPKQALGKIILIFFTSRSFKGESIGRNQVLNMSKFKIIFFLLLALSQVLHTLLFVHSHISMSLFIELAF